MEQLKSRKIITVAILLLIAILSFFVLSKYASSADFHAKTIASLDDKKKTVLELTAGSTAASAAITLIPGDVATPLAEKLADLSTYFLLVLCAVYLEKYLVTILGYAAFRYLIPVAFVLFAGNIFFDNDTVKRLASKLLVFGIAIFLLIPTSVGVSNMIEDTYQDSIRETLDSAKDEEMETKTEATTEEDVVEAEETSGILSWLKKGLSDIQNVAENAKESISEVSAEGVTKKAEDLLNHFVEAAAVMIVTSCVIPILVLAFFGWLVKIILEVDFSIPSMRGLKGKIRGIKVIKE